jgi:hypothetical protein
MFPTDMMGFEFGMTQGLSLVIQNTLFDAIRRQVLAQYHGRIAFSTTQIDDGNVLVTMVRGDPAINSIDNRNGIDDFFDNSFLLKDAVPQRSVASISLSPKLDTL